MYNKKAKEVITMTTKELREELIKEKKQKVE